jgi:Holliday junction DNA helicase RuvA
MIAGLRGVVVGANAYGLVHLRCGPVTLELRLPAAQAGTLSASDEVELFTYMHVATASDTIRLYGFDSALGRDLFVTLLGGPGVGPKVALALMDLGVAGLVAAVREGDEAVLTSVKGVGVKLAKKIILELSEKVAKEFAQVQAPYSSDAPAPATPAGDALDAVIALGYSRVQADTALAKARKDYDGDDTATLIRRMLATLARSR